MICLFLCSLLASSVFAFSWEYKTSDFKEVDNKLPEDEIGEQLPGKCWLCKWVMKKVKKVISNSATQDEIKEKLGAVCDQVGFLKNACRQFVNQWSDVLIEELSTADNVQTICVNVNACKRKP